MLKRKRSLIFGHYLIYFFFQFSVLLFQISTAFILIPTRTRDILQKSPTAAGSCFYTKKKLEEIYEKYADEYDLCLVNIGPKSQCLAIAEFSQNHEDVQVLYPKPYKWTQELPEHESHDPISSGISRTYFFEYPLT